MADALPSASTSAFTSSPACEREPASVRGDGLAGAEAHRSDRAASAPGDLSRRHLNASETASGPRSEETWRRIPSAPGYWASDLGRIRSVDRYVKRSDGRELHQRGQMLKPGIASSGYLVVDLPSGTRYVHALVLEAFAGPPEPGQECLHGAAGPLVNIWPDNLRYGSHAENEADKRLWGKRVSANVL